MERPEWYGGVCKEKTGWSSGECIFLHFGCDYPCKRRAEEIEMEVSEDGPSRTYSERDGTV